MRSDLAIRGLVFLVVAAAAGCPPPPERNDPIAETKRMIEEAERAGRGGSGRNVLVRVERVRASAADAAGLNALWRYAGGRVTASGGGLASAGVRLGAAEGSFQTELTAFARQARGLDRASEEILVGAGQQGYLWTGRNALVPVLRVRSAGGEAVVLENVQVGAQLAVRPNLLADGSIELELHPYFSVLSGPRAGQSLSVDSLSTRVIVAPGQKLVVGSAASTAESVGTALFGYDAAGKQTATLITVTAEKL